MMKISRSQSLVRFRKTGFCSIPKIGTKFIARQSRSLLDLYGTMSRNGPYISSIPIKLPLAHSRIGNLERASEVCPRACQANRSKDWIDGIHAPKNPTYGLVCQVPQARKNPTDTFLAPGQDTDMDVEALAQEFSSRLSLAMDLAGWEKRGRKTNLAKELGVSSTAATKWIDGKGLPSVEHTIQIATLLNVCVEWLFTGRGDMRPLPPLTEEERRHLENLRLLSPNHRQHVFQTGEVLAPSYGVEHAA